MPRSDSSSGEPRYRNSSSRRSRHDRSPVESRRRSPSRDRRDGYVSRGYPRYRRYSPDRDRSFGQRPSGYENRRAGYSRTTSVNQQVKRQRVRSPGRGREPSRDSSASPSTKRAWKFDSPPRDDAATSKMDCCGTGMGNLPPDFSGPLTLNGVHGIVSKLITDTDDTVTSPMSVVAQSLGLTTEQQKSARELHVENLPPALELSQMIEFFSAALQTLRMAPWLQGSPVLRVWLASNRQFAFVEFRTIEEASLALSLNGIACLGYDLRIRRLETYPAEYASMIGALPVDVPGSGPPACPAAALAAATAAAAGVSGSGCFPPSASTAMMAAQAAAVGLGVPRRLVKAMPDRLVALDLPGSAVLPEERLRKHLSSFGEIKIFQQFEVDTGEVARVCIFEYARMSDQKAFLASNKKIDGHEFRVVTAEEAILSADGRFTEVLKKAAAHGRDIQKELGGDLMKPQVATRCIMLANLVTPEELVDDKEYYDIVDDVYQEVSEFGKVITVEIPRKDPVKFPQITDLDIGYAFVEMASLEAAGRARKSLTGRKFGGRTVEASYFSEVLFRDRDFRNPQPNFDPSHSSSKNPELASHVAEILRKDEEDRKQALIEREKAEQEAAAKLALTTAAAGSNGPLILSPPSMMIHR